MRMKLNPYEETLIVSESEVPESVKKYLNNKEDVLYEGYIIRDGHWLSMEKRQAGLEIYMTFSDFLARVQ